MSQDSQQNSSMRSLFGLVIGLCLWLITMGVSFYGGVLYSGAGGSRLIEVEVTREVVQGVEVEVTREVEVIREVAVSSSDNGEESMAEVEPETAEEVIVTPVVEGEEEAEVAAEPEQEGEPITDLSVDDLALFFEVWNTIEASYDGDLPSVDVLNEALINASLDAVGDDYTRYVNPEVAARFREDLDGTFEGIGAYVGETDEGFIEIVRPIPGQPAEAAGLQSNDLIIEVDGEDITEQTIDEVIAKVRGPRGTEVTLGIAREGEDELLQITIVRARVEIPVVESELLENGIGYIRLTSFNAVSAERLTTATEEMIAQNASGIILDLRDNPGGLLDASIQIADLYLEESVILYERGSFGIDETFMADNGDIGEDIPLVVLINGGSASASELVALALRDNGRATLIGETSFGKGSVQQLNGLSNGGELRVTIARWYSPLNETISEEGVAPDIEVTLDPDTPATIAGEGDLQFDRAIEFLLTGE